MHSKENIFLVGMMGAGKTTVGRQLAKRLKLRFVDTDHEIEARTGVHIPLIFEIEGEAGFRRREAQVLAALTQENNLVLATGGGAVLDPINRANLAKNGIVVYLSVPPARLWERLRQDKKRPLLQVADPLGRLMELHAQRDPLYREVADLVVEGGGGSSQHLATLIERELQERFSA
ncbi:MAG TPA: shikimate kinase [Rhodocyclaceae bacterium]|nr:shikimate kinase [Rhodocyclaceae bacterium]